MSHFLSRLFREKNAAATVARGPVPRDLHRHDVSASVVCDRLITNESRSGDLDLQRRDKLSVARDLSPKTKTVRSPKATDGFCDERGTARACPSPYGAQSGFLRFTVARGPVPRDLPTETKTVCSPQRPRTFAVKTEAWRGKPARMRVWHARALALRCGDAVRIARK